MNIRLATPNDYAQIAEIRNFLFPDIYETAEKLIESDNLREKKIKFCRWVAEIDSKIVGEAYYTQLLELFHPQKFFIDVVVLPKFQNKGIGSALYNEVVNVLEKYVPIQYLAHAQDRHPTSIRFLSQRSFKEVGRERISHLDVKSFNLSAYDDLNEKLKQNEIIFKKLHELKSDKDYEHRLYDLEWELINEIPGNIEPLVKQRFEEWCKSSLNHPEIIHDSFHVAIKNDEYIGYSSLWGGSDKILVHNGMTGVKKKFRGLGIATKLKVLGATYAKENKFEILWTCNSLENKPFLSINEKLGYKKQYETIEMIKTL